MNQSVLEVCDRDLYDPTRNRAIVVNGPLDPRMGVSTKTGFCETCGEALQQCNGHFGYVKLALPAFHIGYMKMIISTLQNICKVEKIQISRTVTKLMPARTVLEYCCPRKNVGSSFVICAGQTSIT